MTDTWTRKAIKWMDKADKWTRKLIDILFDWIQKKNLKIINLELINLIKTLTEIIGYLSATMRRKEKFEISNKSS